MKEKAGKRPLRIINGVAPIRICDNGGWTDTWFAKTGKIFNIGVYPYVEVQVEVFHRDDQPQPVVVFAENYGQRFSVTQRTGGWGEHPLLEAAIERMKVPLGSGLERHDIFRGAERSLHGHFGCGGRGAGGGARPPDPRAPDGARGGLHGPGD